MDAPLEISSVVRCETATQVWDVVSLLLAWEGRLPAGTALRWELPADGPLLAAEAEQVLGLVAAVDAAGPAGSGPGAAVEVVGRLRHQAAGIAVRWARAALTVDGPVPQALDVLRFLPSPLMQGLHLLDLQDDSDGDPLWRHNVDLLAQAALQEGSSLSFGVTLPPPPFSSEVSRSVQALRRQLAGHGLHDALVAMRVRGPLHVADSGAILDFADGHGLSVDLSLSHDQAGHGEPRPYIDSGAYRPQPFDLRSPRLGSSGPVLEFPRHDARRALRAVSDSRQRARFLSDWLFDLPQEAMIQRLRPVLDRAAQRAYQARVNVDLSLISEWTQYFVHNWAPPPSHRLALLEVEALDLLDPDSAVRRACTQGVLSERDGRLHPAAHVLSLARQQADVQARGGAEQALREQVAGHGYLSDGGRPEMSGDSRSLLPLLPSRTDRTLEIGCGYGVMARHAAELAELYVGVDLLLEQAQALREVGAHGVPADMHQLPFVAESFQTVIADNVLEHSYDPLALLAELRRVTQPGGRLYAVIPPDLASREHSLRLHLWKTDREGLQAALSRAGFVLEQCHEIAYARVGAPGSFPSSHERTLLVVATRGEVPPDESWAQELSLATPPVSCDPQEEESAGRPGSSGPDGAGA